jgi:hypothetical protein
MAHNLLYDTYKRVYTLETIGPSRGHRQVRRPSMTHFGYTLIQLCVYEHFVLTKLFFH